MRRTVAVIGAGITGSSVAVALARRRVKVILIDAAAAPMTGASRFNEGKIHLGYLYGADPTLRTARRLLPGGLAFARTVRELFDIDPRRHATDHDDRYVVHRDSVVPLAQLVDVARGVADIARGHPDADDYLVPLDGRRPVVLSPDDLDGQVDPAVIGGGLAVPERSVATEPIADAVDEVLRGTAGVELLTGHRVTGATRSRGGWTLDATVGHDRVRVGPVDVVVNAAWEGRAAIDEAAGFDPPPPRTHRYRVSLFARTARPVDLRSTVIAVGPFGDVKNYDGRSLYLSWYDAGLLSTGEDVAPPPTPTDIDEAAVAAQTLDSLASILTDVADVADDLEEVRVRGGWVYAAGTGALDDPRSRLHRRDRIGVEGDGDWLSVDTGKYSIGPWLGMRVAASMLD